MNKSSLIRINLENYGFTQIGRKNCFISYTNEYCLEIKFEKISYGSRWNIDCNVFIINEQGFQLDKCPSYNDKLHAIGGLSASMEKWDANTVQMNFEKQQYESNTKTDPNVYAESMMFVINNYIVPYFTWVALFTKAKDSSIFSYLKFNHKKIHIEDTLKFNPTIDLEKYEDINSLKKYQEFKQLFEYFEHHFFKKVKEEKNKIHYKNYERDIYVIVRLEHHLFLSFIVFVPKDNESQREQLITFFKDSFLNFGWFVGNRDSINKNLQDAIKALKHYINNPEPSEKKEELVDYRDLQSFSAEEILKKKFNL